jgi:hypothetical protein
LTATSGPSLSQKVPLSHVREVCSDEQRYSQISRKSNRGSQGIVIV